MNSYSKLNNLLGWVCFSVALLTYVLTLEGTVSYWDCGEFIACIQGMQVPHQPGAPLFLMIYKTFSLLAGNDTTQVAYYTNLASAFASAFTILFLFWTITALAKRLLHPEGDPVSPGQKTGILACGAVGSLAYTFSDSFWFSAVETEVYALSFLCTALVFWAILKWDAAARTPRANRWLVLIAFITGLSIGVHLLSLLAIPAVVLIWYFRHYRYSKKGLFYALLAGTGLLLFIQYGIIPSSLAVAGWLELLFVNGFGLPFHSGLLLFVVLLAGSLGYGLYYTARKHKVVLNTALLCLTYIYIGFASYTMILLRAQAGTNINISRPDHAFSLLYYLNREQYLQQPLLTGPDYTSRGHIEETKTPELSRYRKVGQGYRPGAYKQEITYDHTTLFPRLWNSESSDFYRNWLGLEAGERPTFTDNLRFFFSYQLGHMYWRYFMWNFTGRVNDMQGINPRALDGNWISGIKPLDELRLGNMSVLPERITNNKAHNKLYALPLLLGLAGLAWQLRRSRKDFLVTASFFALTGIAIIVYLNQYQIEPRERDYAFAGSFYVFAIWIGLGAGAIQQFLQKKLRPAAAGYLACAVCLPAVPLLMAVQEWDDHDRSGRTFARDLAYNHLISADKNSILITNGDNDTYPLWYMQEVEKFRPDVRVGIFQFFGADHYIDQLNQPMNQSAPLPLSVTKDRDPGELPDWMPVIDKGLKDPVALKELMAFATTDSPEYKVQLSNGMRANYFPTRKFKITVDKEKALRSGLTAEGEQMASALEWEYGSDLVYKRDLVLLDLLTNQDWERPLYLAGMSAPTLTLDLDDYYRNEGLAVRLTPVKKAPDQEGGNFRTGIDQLYENLMKKYRWNGLCDEHLYVDSETVDMISRYRNMFTGLATACYQAGQTDTCVKVLDKMSEVLPPRFEFSRSLAQNIQTLPQVQMAELYYQCDHPEKGDRLLNEARHFIADSLHYYASLQPRRRQVYTQDIRAGLFILNQMQALARTHNRRELDELINRELPGYLKEFKLRI